jgi:O-acetyl-ADP-ribose deacetylase (regulator of RNase III)
MVLLMGAGEDSMIESTQGDLLAADAEALVNTVNCVGIMGRGVALQFKEAFPDNFTAYAQACKEGQVQPGRMFVFATGQLTNPKWIINFPTKRHWRGNSRIEDIEAGLADLVKVIREHDIRSVAMPPLGSGLGGLPWPAVKTRIVDALEDVPDLKVLLFEPRPDGDRMKRHAKKAPPELTPKRAALVVLMDRYLRALFEPCVTLLEVHKLAYFMQEAGLAMKLSFARGHYGPYAENLRHVLREMEGYHTAGYGDGGDQPAKPIEIVSGTLEQAEPMVEGDADTLAAFKRIEELVEGFETPVGLELLATTHWAVTREKARSLDDVARVFAGWNSRKSTFTPRQIGIALNQLERHGWVSVAA